MKFLDEERMIDNGNLIEKPTWRYYATKASIAVIANKTYAMEAN